MNCIFCKIAKGEIPCYKVYEDHDFLAFLDIHPLNKGHCLIIPKKHYRWVYDVDDTKYWAVANTIANKLVALFGAQYVCFITWGLEVEHAHIHVVPRYENDGFSGFIDWKKTKEFSADEMKKIAEKLI